MTAPSAHGYGDVAREEPVMHAYYLQYKNVKADFVKAFWNIANWQDVAQRFQRAREVPPTV